MREYVVRIAQRQLVCLAFAGTLASILYLVTPTSPKAQGLSQVIGSARVVDGDTIVINEVRIRLEGIDAPESTQACEKAKSDAAPPAPALPFGQPNMLGKPDRPGNQWAPNQWACGIAATRHLAHMIGHAEVRCDDLGPDKYGRTLGRCFVGTLNLNAAMVRDGYAWAYVKYSKDYVSLEAEARTARVGIWQGDAMPAWDYRKRAWETAAVVTPAGCTIKGNVSASGKVYHMPWNTWYEKVKMEPSRATTETGLAGGKRWFCSEQDAIDAGWRPALTR
jgi:endonuclease YncB( thermonuclease family)